MSEEPIGVKIIAVVTLIGTLLATLILGWAEVLLFFYFGISVLAAYILVALILQGYAFIISIAMLVSDSKYAWYASVAFWISIIVAELSFTFSFSFIASVTVLAKVLLFSPILSSIICLHFFLKEKVKDYFNV